MYGGKDAQGLKNVRLYHRHTHTWDTLIHLHRWPRHTSGTQMYTHAHAHAIYEAYTHSHSCAHMHTHNAQYFCGYTRSCLFAHTHTYVLTHPHCICTLPPLLCLPNPCLSFSSHPKGHSLRAAALTSHVAPRHSGQALLAPCTFFLCLPLICHGIIVS